MSKYRIANWRAHNANNLDAIKDLADNSIDSIVTDPPYEIAFMGRDWDNSGQAYNEQLWRECLRVLKPGGHLIAFGATRTIHRTTSAIEASGFEIRDLISWLYFSGFPKSLDISKAIDKHFCAEREVIGKAESWNRPQSKLGDTARMNNSKSIYDITAPSTQEAQQWNGFGTALKPAQEPAVLARKPIEQGSIAKQVLSTGTGALNIDGCRFGYGDPCWIGPKDLSGLKPYTRQVEQRESQAANHKHVNFTDHPQGRWPANLYQCPKASRSEREEGLDHLEGKSGADVVDRKEGSAGLNNPRAGAGRTARTFGTKTCIKCGRKAINISGQCECDDPVFVHEHRYKDGGVRNIHPTVKPIKLMRWCCRLIGGQKGSTILDPFAGSGTTLIAGILEGFDVIGMEMTDDYLPIIEGRVQWAKEQYKRENAQLSLFGGEL